MIQEYSQKFIDLMKEVREDGAVDSKDKSSFLFESLRTLIDISLYSSPVIAEPVIEYIKAKNKAIKEDRGH